MANLTFTQVNDYCRGNLGEYDTQKITPGDILVDANLSQRKVQKDLMPLLVKYFTKQEAYEGPITAIPSDLMSTPDAIISVAASTGNLAGTYAYVQSTWGSSNDFLLKSVEPGTIGNGGVLTILDIGDPNAPALGTVRYEGVTPFDFDVWIDGGTTTLNALIGYLQANPAFNEFMTIEAASGSLGTNTVPSGDSFLLANGIGTGWYPARELTIEEYKRFKQSTTTISYKAPSATDPAYCLMGDTSGINRIHFLPNSPPASAVRASRITYKYVVADMTATSSLSIPVDYEEVVLFNLMAMLNERLNREQEKMKWEKKYRDEVDKKMKDYQDSLMTKLQEKKRMQSADQES